MSLLTFNKLTIGYENNHVLKDLSFAIDNMDIKHVH